MIFFDIYIRFKIFFYQIINIFEFMKKIFTNRNKKLSFDMEEDESEFLNLEQKQDMND